MAGLDEGVAAKVLKQIEFYFSESNLPRDNFLRTKVEEGDGYVDLELLCSFKRMREHLGIKTADTPISKDLLNSIAELLRSKSTELEVDEAGTRVKRKNPISEEAAKTFDARSIHATPFPWNISLEEVHDFFAGHAQVKSVRLRMKAGTKLFSGSVFVELATEDEAKGLLDKDLEFQGAKIRVQPKLKWIEENREQFEADQQQRQARQKKEEAQEAEEEDIEYDKGLIVSFEIKDLTKTEEKAGASDEGDKAGPSGAAGGDGDEEKFEEEKEEEEGPRIQREDVSKAVEGLGVVKFIDYLRGNPGGFVRFESPDGAQATVKASEAADEGGLKLADGDRYMAVFKLLEGDDEKGYWVRLRQGQRSYRESRGGGRGGRGGNRGRGGRGAAGGEGAGEEGGGRGGGEGTAGKWSR
ncbi:lupus La protein, partial [Klebsormidium nitens]